MSPLGTISANKNVSLWNNLCQQKIAPFGTISANKKCLPLEQSLPTKNVSFWNNLCQQKMPKKLYIYKHSGKGTFGRRLHNAKLFERIEHSGNR